MIHLSIELLPFVAGYLYGFIAWPITKKWWPNLFIGALAACVAGELASGIPTATLALIVDSAAAAAGCLLAFRRRALAAMWHYAVRKLRFDAHVWL
jgi:hypothetical protein